MPTPLLELPTARVDVDALVVLRDGESFPLTVQEADLLRYLARADRTVSREELLQKVWGYAPTVRTRAVDATVSRIRVKLEPDPAHPQSLLSVRGKGYRLEVIPSLAPSATVLGRDRERARLRRLLDHEGAVQLVGRGGAGKTTLARELVADRGGRFVDLAGARTLGEATATLATALGLDLSRDTDDATWSRIEWVLARSIEPVVLDNLEQIEPAFARRLAPLRRTGGALVLTSRSPVVPGWSTLEVGALRGGPARELLTRAARRVRPDWEGETSALDAVVELVDGLPLALELVGSRLPIVPPDRLMAREGGLLAMGDGREGRHATLADSIRWSWSLLEPEEQRVARLWACLEGGLSVDALEALTPEVDVVAVLDRLTRAGWVDTTAQPVRFWVAVRSFLRLTLDEAGEREEAERAVTAWVLSAVPESVDALEGPERTGLRRRFAAIWLDLLAAIDRTRPEHPEHTVRLALAALSMQHLLSAPGSLHIALASMAAAKHTGQPGLVLEARLALVRVQRRLGDSGPVDENLARCREALERVDAPGSWARFWMESGNWHRRAGRLDDALEAYAHGRSRALDAGLGHRAARFDHDHGATMRRLGRLDEARTLLMRCAGEARGLDDPALACLALQALTSIARVQLALDHAVQLGEAAVESGRASGDDHVLGGALTNLANVHFTRGDSERSVALNREAVEVLRRGGFDASLSFVLGNLASALRMRGELVEAELLTSEARQLALRTGTPYAAAVWRSRLAELAHERGSPGEAALGYEEALHELDQQEAHPQLEQVHAAAAAVQAELGHADAARRHLDAARPLATGTELDQAMWVLLGSVARFHLGEPSPTPLEALPRDERWVAEQEALGYAWRLFSRTCG
ncbi:MAG: winged helix-turn-helix domain-containing protein [Myxococcota bacterium]